VTEISLDQVEQLLIEEENEVLHAYPDHLGFLTLGVGRLVDPRKGGGITREESRYLLRNDTAKRLVQCRERFAWFERLDPVRQQVVLCMTFQLGVEGVAGFKRMIAGLKIRDYITASLEMLDSQWRLDTPARCERMARIMRTGEWE
jgi:lysozyme